MLAGKPDGKSDDDGEMSSSEARERAEDAAMAFANAVEAKDAKRIVKAFGSLSTLCGHLDELGDEYEEDEKKDEEESPAEEETSDEE